MKRLFKLFVIIVVFIIAVFAIYYSWYSWGNVIHIKNKSDSGVDFFSGIVGSILAAMVAAFLAWVAWEQWGNINITSSTDFFHRLTKDFFTPETRILMSLIECKALKYIKPHPLSGEEITDDGLTESQPYFEVKQNMVDKTKLPEELKADLTKKNYYSTWDVEDLILNHFEDIGLLEYNGTVDFYMVYAGFSYYFETVWSNNDIKKHINYYRNVNPTNNDGSNFYYYHFQYIYTKCYEFDKQTPGLGIIWWRIRRQYLRIIPKVKKEIELKCNC